MGGLNKNRIKKKPKKVSNENEFKLVIGKYELPARELCEESSPAWMPTYDERFRYLIRKWSRSGRTVEFYIALQKISNGKWEDCITIDCKHSHVHAHHYENGNRVGNPVPIKVLNTIGDVKNGVNEAISYLRKQEKVLFDDGERK